MLQKYYNVSIWRGEGSMYSMPPYVKLSQADSPKSNEERAMMAKVPNALVVGSLVYVDSY